MWVQCPPLLQPPAERIHSRTHMHFCTRDLGILILVALMIAHSLLVVLMTWHSHSTHYHNHDKALAIHYVRALT